MALPGFPPLGHGCRLRSVAACGGAPTTVNSEIVKKMEECASPGFYFEVTPTQGISEAMTALFQRAIADARISK